MAAFAQTGLKVYLAGPDCFRCDAAEHFVKMKALAVKYGFTAFSPLDSEVDIGSPSILSTIFRINLEDIDKADAIVANCSPFRGQCVDDGTAFELGVAFARGVPILAYTPCLGTPVKERLAAAFKDPVQAKLYDQDGFPRSEDFPGANTATDPLQQPGTWRRASYPPLAIARAVI